jgi:DNA-binding cell septation regulator SpoVG
MTTDISEYRLTNKRMTGQTLKLFFKKRSDEKLDKVLELKNVAAFIDNLVDQQLIMVDIRNSAGSYGFDIALRLKRPEVQNFKEVFIYTDTTLINSVFRALAENIVWRDFDNITLSDINH